LPDKVWFLPYIYNPSLLEKTALDTLSPMARPSRRGLGLWAGQKWLVRRNFVEGALFWFGGTGPP
jgi:hypothetical protein